MTIDAHYEVGVLDVIEHYVDADGKKIHVIEAGKGEPLVLVHGLSVYSSSVDWLPYFEQLGDSFRVFALDLPGWGKTDIPEDYSFELWINALKAVMDSFDLQRADITGFSLGA